MVYDAVPIKNTLPFLALLKFHNTVEATLFNSDLIDHKPHNNAINMGKSENSCGCFRFAYLHLKTGFCMHTITSRQ